MQAAETHTTDDPKTKLVASDSGKPEEDEEAESG